MERTGKRLRVKGLEGLGVPMDAMLPGVVRAGMQGSRRPPEQPVVLPLPGGGQSGREGGWGNGRGEGSCRVSAARAAEVRCLNPQTLSCTWGDREPARKPMDRFFPRGKLSGPPVMVTRIPKVVVAPVTGKGLMLQVEIRKRDRESGRMQGSNGMVPGDVTVFSGRPWVPPGKGSHQGEAEA